MLDELMSTLNMFVFLAVKLSVLFIGISLLVGILQRHIPTTKIESLLSSSRVRSYFLAAALGAITPFCSCSTVPMLKGLIRARAGFGPTMVFLFTSPLLNPVVVVLLLATFGATLTFIYVVAALGVSLSAGWTLQRFRFDRYVRPQVSGLTSTCNVLPLAGAVTPAMDCCATDPTTSNAQEPLCSSQALNTSSCSVQQHAQATTPRSHHRYHGLWRETWSEFVDVLPYLLIGVVIGSIIYGFMPVGFLERYAGPQNPLAIPAAAVIGLPLYVRAETVIPLAAGLMAKGAGAGTVLALIIGSAGASLPELILLRGLFTLKLVAAFTIVVLSMAILAGYATFLLF